MKLQKMAPTADGPFATTEKETEARQISRQTDVVFIKQTQSPTLHSATEKKLPVAAGFLADF